MRSPVVLSIVVGVSSLLFAQATPTTPQPPDDEPNVRVLLERIQQLEKRISDLEARDSRQAALPAPAPAPSPAPEATGAPSTPLAEEHEHAPNPAVVQEAEQHYPSLQIRGFGDVDFSASDQKGSVSGFDLGQLVLHLASPLSRKITYFGEVSFTAGPSSYDLQVERSIIRYDYNDYFKL